MKQPFGVILAGGLARRMGGGDKALLPLGRGVVLDEVLARIEPQVAGVCLNANGDGARFAQFGLPVLADPLDGYLGPLAGVLAGMEWAQAQGGTHVVSVAADTPFFPCDLVPRLMLASEGARIALAKTTNGRHPTFGLWPVDLVQDLRAALEDGLRKVVAWTDGVGCASADFPDTPFDPFFNINTPEDLAHAETLL